jgi:hypothetical protein
MVVSYLQLGGGESAGDSVQSVSSIETDLEGAERSGGPGVTGFLVVDGPTERLAIMTAAAAIPRMTVLDFEALATDYFFRPLLLTCVAFAGSWLGLGISICAFTAMRQLSSWLRSLAATAAFCPATSACS